jgi:hypothetical protein
LPATKLSPADELEKIKKLLPRQRAEALKAATSLVTKLSKQQSLYKEELEVLVITGTLLHENGKDADALKHLRRFHNEIAKDPSIVDKHPALAWGELLYTTISTRMDFAAALKSDADMARKNSPPVGKAAQGAAGGAAQRAASSGCSIVATFVCCAAMIFAACAVLVIVSAFG